MADSVATDADQPWLAMPVDWAPAPEAKAILIIDLPGAEAVHLGLALARRGYRPVPLHNAFTGLSELIDQRPILRALQAGAVYLTACALPADAPPAFLLDSRRQSLPRPLRPGMFDNRWKVFPSDMPSAPLLHRRGVSRAILVQRTQRKPLSDIARVLYSWQEGQIALEIKDITDTAPPCRLVVPPIPWYQRWWYGLLSRFGLDRSPRDGFGYFVQESSHG
jgi:hypothetical protein